jgi:hypothetical protein
MDWVFKGLLARSSRPGYPETKVLVQAVESWVQHICNQGIRAIICVLSQDELVAYYKQLPRGLLHVYREQGLEVEVIPLPDYADPPVEAQLRNSGWRRFTPPICGCQNPSSSTVARAWYARRRQSGFFGRKS